MIERIAVLGAGTMGRGIAYVAIAAGYPVQLFDVSLGVVEGAMSSIRTLAEKAVQRKDLTAVQCRDMLARLSTSTSIAEAVQHADFVIEAVSERIEIKLTTFEALQNNAPPTAVLATNTSALSITEMASVLDDPSRLAGMHFFNPVHRMKLVEIVRALETGDGTIAAIQDVAARMGKETVLVRESPGFITSRLNALLGNEAFYMLQEGVGTARDIDKAAKLGLNHPMGPFELVDLVGLDTRLAILQHLYRTLGEKFRPCPLLEQYVKAGRLGRKTGQGVYEY
jgi:3-hydroxybutyryl-CoA dehydrogenase